MGVQTKPESNRIRVILGETESEAVDALDAIRAVYERLASKEGIIREPSNARE